MSLTIYFCDKWYVCKYLLMDIYWFFSKTTLSAPTISTSLDRFLSSLLSRLNPWGFKFSEDERSNGDTDCCLESPRGLIKLKSKRFSSAYFNLGAIGTLSSEAKTSPLVSIATPDFSGLLKGEDSVLDMDSWDV